MKMKASKDLTWEELVKMEPALGELYREAAMVTSDNDPHFCANKVWYSRGGLKGRLVHLVGWARKKGGHPDLETSEAYSLAYQKIYGALPDCRDCGCGPSYL